MSSILNGLDGFRTQIAIWGYVAQGDLTEFSATICETRQLDEHLQAWDRPMTWLYRFEIWHGDQPKVPPYWWALPWVSESQLPESVQRVGHEQRRRRDDGPVFAEATKDGSTT